MENLLDVDMDVLQESQTVSNSSARYCVLPACLDIVLIISGSFTDYSMLLKTLLLLFRLGIQPSQLLLQGTHLQSRFKK